MSLHKMDKEFLKQKLLIRRIIMSSPDGKYVDCWWYPGSPDTDGYGRIGISSKCYQVHRVSAWIYGLKDPKENPYTLEPEDNLYIDKNRNYKKYQVLHRCDFPACTNPDHLFIDTHSENMKDMYKKGRDTNNLSNAVNKGCKAKLTYKEVVQIKDLYSCGGFTMRRIAEIYNVSPGTICGIISNKPLIRGRTK